MATQPAVSTVEHGGFTVTSSNPEEVVRESLKQSPETTPADTPEKAAKPGKPDLSKAASELGRKGGKAAAKARQEREATEEAPDAPEAPEKAAKPAKEAPEASEEATDADEGEEEAPEAGRGDPRHDPKARIAQLARERNEERQQRQREAERAARLERELEAARRGAAPVADQRQDARPESRQEPQGAPQKPQQGDYETYEEYLDARDEWRQNQWERQFVAKVTAHREATKYAREVETVASGWQTRLQKAVEADPEFPDKARPALTAIGFPTRLLPEGEPGAAPNWAADYLTSAGDNARDLLLYLSEHQADLQRIITLEAPHAVARELAMIEASLKRPAAATTGTSAGREVSRANPPVTPVTGSPTVADGDVAPKPGESFDQWFARTGKNQKR